MKLLRKPTRVHVYIRQQISHILLIKGDIERKVQCWEIFEEIIVENIPSLVEDINLQM
jgi:hypothetical protein